MTKEMFEAEKGIANRKARKIVMDYLAFFLAKWITRP